MCKFRTHEIENLPIFKNASMTSMEITKKYINELTYKIVGACIEVHKIVGPGLYEDVYHKCLQREFDLLGLKYKSELEIPLTYIAK